MPDWLSETLVQILKWCIGAAVLLAFYLIPAALVRRRRRPN